MNFYANLDYSVSAYSHVSDLESVYMARDGNCYTCNSWFQRAVHVISDFFFQTKIKRIVSVFERVVQDYYALKSNPITDFFNADEEVEALHIQKERVDFVVSMIGVNQEAFERSFGRLPIHQVFITYMQKEYENPAEPVVKLDDWLDEYREKQIANAEILILERRVSEGIRDFRENEGVIGRLRETVNELHLEREQNKSQISGHAHVVETMKLEMSRQKEEIERLKEELRLNEGANREEILEVLTLFREQMVSAVEEHKMLERAYANLTEH